MNLKIYVEKHGKKKYSYLKINRLDEDEKYTICNESDKEYKIFKPKTQSC